MSRGSSPNVLSGGLQARGGQVSVRPEMVGLVGMELTRVVVLTACPPGQAVQTSITTPGASQPVLGTLPTTIDYDNLTLKISWRNSGSCACLIHDFGS